MEDVIDIDVGDWVAFVRDGKVKYAKVEYISTTPRSSFPQSFAGALLFAIEVKNVRILHTTEGSVRSEYVLECRKAHSPREAAPMSDPFAFLSDLEPNWDSYGGKPIDPRCIAKARAFMVHLGGGFHVIPCSDGGVALEGSYSNGVEVDISFSPPPSGNSGEDDG